MINVDAIRAALRSAGFTSRKVSVRRDGYSMGETIHITIRDASVVKSEIERICQGFEQVDRDPATGEILCGRNSFVSIDYARSVIELVAMPLAEVIAAAAPGVVVEVGGEKVAKVNEYVHYIDEDGVGHRGTWCGSGTTASSCLHAATQIATRMIERQSAAA